jgi:hypothetical protein
MNKPEKLAYVTSNRSLAIALHLSGARILGYWREYSPAELQKLERTVEEAVRDDIGGKDVFFIENVDHREALEAAFDMTAVSLRSEAPISLPSVTDADAAKIACMVLKLRGEIASMRRDPRCAQVIDSHGEATVTTDEKTGERFVEHPGFSVHSATASQPIRDYLKSK